MEEQSVMERVPNRDEIANWDKRKLELAFFASTTKEEMSVYLAHFMMKYVPKDKWFPFVKRPQITLRDHAKNADFKVWPWDGQHVWEALVHCHRFWYYDQPDHCCPQQDGL